MPLKGEHGLIGKSVVDSEGVELGYVNAEDDRFLRLAKGPSGTLFLGKRLVHNVGDRITLGAPIFELLNNMNVVDSLGEYVGIVRDVVESGGMLDSIVAEDEEGEMVMVLLEDIRTIDQWIELALSQEELYQKQQS